MVYNVVVRHNIDLIVLHS